MKKLVCLILVFVLGMTAAVMAEQPEAGPDEENTMLERLYEFLSFWKQEDYDGMLELCSPAWKSGLDNGRMELFFILGTKIPVEYEIVNVIGIPEDGFRSVTIDVTMDTNNGKEQSRYRYTVGMVREDGQWYVDPESLLTGWQRYYRTQPGTDSTIAMAQRALEFFSCWGRNDDESMLEVCSPAWRDMQENARLELLSTLGVVKPTDFRSMSVGEITGDNTCDVFLDIMIDPCNGKDPELRHCIVMMVMSDGQWYVDPYSFRYHETIVTEPESPEAAEDANG